MVCVVMMTERVYVRVHGVCGGDDRACVCETGVGLKSWLLGSEYYMFRQILMFLAVTTCCWRAA
jgi:hypothetical protein